MKLRLPLLVFVLRYISTVEINTSSSHTVERGRSRFLENDPLVRRGAVYVHTYIVPNVKNVNCLGSVLLLDIRV